MDNGINSQNLSRELSRTVKITSGTRSNLSGSVTDYGSMVSAIPALPAFVYQLVNSTSATKNFLIGDPAGMIAAALGGTFYDPNKLNGSTAFVEPNKNIFYGSSVLFGEISWKTSSDATQFDNNPTLYVCNHTGEVVPKPLILTAAERNTQQNNLLLTTKGKVRLDIFRGIKVPVIAGETLTVTMSPEAYTTP